MWPGTPRDSKQHFIPQQTSIDNRECILPEISGREKKNGVHTPTVFRDSSVISRLSVSESLIYLYLE